MTTVAEIVAVLKERGIEYPSRLPKTVPVRRFLVHNSVRPSRKQGLGGARFWLQKTDVNLEPCACTWAPELGGHYRIKAKAVTEPEMTMEELVIAMRAVAAALSQRLDQQRLRYASGTTLHRVDMVADELRHLAVRLQEAQKKA